MNTASVLRLSSWIYDFDNFPRETFIQVIKNFDLQGIPRNMKQSDDCFHQHLIATIQFVDSDVEMVSESNLKQR